MSRERRERSRKRNQLIMGSILILLMVASTAGFALLNRSYLGSNNGLTSETKNFNGIEFTRSENFGGDWVFQSQGGSFVTRNTPEDVEDILFSTISNIGRYVDQPLYFVGSGPGISEIARNLQPYSLRAQNACISSEECEGDLPVKGCLDNVIIVKEPEDDLEFIYEEENCIYVIANIENQIRYADKFLFELLDI